MLSKSDGATYTYDNNGNRLTKVDGTGTTTYTWDAENRLKSVQVPGASSATFFSYDPFGRRIVKLGQVVSTKPVYVYDGDNVLEERGSSGTLQARYTMGLGVDEPLAMMRGGQTYYFGQDGLGSVTSLFNMNGSIAAYSYDSYGNLTATTGSVQNPYRFTGREYDLETGLYYYRARYYDPQVGRFLSEDPIQFEGGSNFYRYVDNNPTNYIDPFGLGVLPPDPSGLSPEWVPDPTHRDPSSMRFRNPAGDTLDYTKGKPGQKGWEGKDHWHFNKNKGNKRHYKPGDNVPADTQPKPHVPWPFRRLPGPFPVIFNPCLFLGPTFPGCSENCPAA